MKFRVLIIFCLPIFICGYFLPDTTPASEKLDFLYLQQLHILKLQITGLETSAKQKKSSVFLQQQFKKARLTYKQLAVLLETFNVRDAKLLNGPPIEWVEDGHPDKILAPHGFQALEQLLFDKWKNENYKALQAETKFILSIITQLENEPDRSYKFDNAQVFDALQKAIVRMITLGISGNDSPLAFYSIEEANATLKGIEKIIHIYQPSLQKKDAAIVKKLLLALRKAQSYTALNTNFNAFNRLDFITEFANPLYALLMQGKLIASYTLPDGLYPTNASATSIFAADFFNINFFSPNENYQPTTERIYLGKMLFYDTILSGNGKRSCASCHQPEKAFTDGLPTALDIDNKTSLRRNTPTLLYSALQTRLFADSRVNVLENQLNEVIHDSHEMQGSLKTSVTLLDSAAGYKQLFLKAYPTQKKPLSEYTIANAIGSYIRSLAPFNSRFDNYMRGNKASLTASEKLGFNLFMGKAKCGTCHFMPLFNGLVPPNFTETESEVLGVPKTTDKKHPMLDEDEGKIAYTQSPVHRFAFKTPTLRNIANTAPYMHNGVYKTLEEVMDFYNEGGGKGLHIAPENQTLPFDKLNLNKKEIQAVIAFMKALSDVPIP